MYTTTLIIFTVCILLTRKWPQTIHHSTLYFTFAVFFILYSIFVFQINYTGGSSYLKLISPDSERYLYEAKIFQCPICINELSGTYMYDHFSYQATPKFGLSAFLSVVSIGWTHSIETAYVSLLAFTFILTLYKIAIIRKIFTKGNTLNFAVLMIAFMPLDYYWYLRMLREPIANNLFAICMILIMYMKIEGRSDRNTLLSFLVVLSLLIIWRSQLALAVSAVCLIIFYRNLRVVATVTPLLALSFLQSFYASGAKILLVAGELPLFQTSLGYLLQKFLLLGSFSGFLYLAALGGLLIRSNSNRVMRQNPLPSALVICVLFILVGIIGSEQTRFMYPFASSIKDIMIIVVLYYFRRNKGEVVLSDVSAYGSKLR